MKMWLKNTAPIAYNAINRRCRVFWRCMAMRRSAMETVPDRYLIYLRKSRADVEAEQRGEDPGSPALLKYKNGPIFIKT